MEGTPASVKLLVRAGADPNGPTAVDILLVAALLAGKDDIVRTLVALGAGVNRIALKTGMTPLMFGAAWGKTDLVKLFLSKGANKSFRAKNGDTALSLARRGGHKPVIALLQ